MSHPIQLEHFRNLVSAAAADGKIADAERNSLQRIAAALGIPRDRLSVMLEHAHEYISMIPQNDTDKHKQLEDMIDIALVDGVFSESERQLILRVADTLGFTRFEAEEIIRAHLQKKGEM